MAKKKSKRPVGTGSEAEGERPLFSYSYELSGSLVSEMASALAGDDRRNPPMIATYVLLVVVLIVAVSPLGQNSALLIALVIIELSVWGLSTKWRAIQERRLRHAGLDPAFVPEDKRRRSVEVYEDRVVVEAPEGEPQTYLVSSMRKPFFTETMLIMVFSGNTFVPAPRKALSTTRFNQLVRLVCEKTGAKAE